MTPLFPPDTAMIHPGLIVISQFAPHDADGLLNLLTRLAANSTHHVFFIGQAVKQLCQNGQIPLWQQHLATLGWQAHICSGALPDDIDPQTLPAPLKASGLGELVALVEHIPWILSCHPIPSLSVREQQPPPNQRAVNTADLPPKLGLFFSQNTTPENLVALMDLAQVFHAFGRPCDLEYRIHIPKTDCLEDHKGKLLLTTFLVQQLQAQHHVLNQIFNKTPHLAENIGWTPTTGHLKWGIYATPALTKVDFRHRESADGHAIRANAELISQIQGIIAPLQAPWKALYQTTASPETNAVVSKPELFLTL